MTDPKHGAPTFPPDDPDDENSVGAIEQPADLEMPPDLPQDDPPPELPREEPPALPEDRPPPPPEPITAPEVPDDSPPILIAEDIEDAEEDEAPNPLQEEEEAEARVRKVQLEREEIKLRRKLKSEQTAELYMDELKALSSQTGITLHFFRNESRPRRKHLQGYQTYVDLADFLESGMPMEAFIAEILGGGRYCVVAKKGRYSTGQKWTFVVGGKSKEIQRDDDDDQKPGEEKPKPFDVVEQLAKLKESGFLKQGEETDAAFTALGNVMQASMTTQAQVLQALAQKDDTALIKMMEEARRETRELLEKQQQRSDSMWEKIIGLATTFGPALIEKLTPKPNPAEDAMAKTLPALFSSMIEMQSKAQSSIMDRFLDVMLQTAGNEDQKGWIHQMRELLGAAKDLPEALGGLAPMAAGLLGRAGAKPPAHAPTLSAPEARGEMPAQVTPGLPQPMPSGAQQIPSGPQQAQQNPKMQGSDLTAGASIAQKLEGQALAAIQKDRIERFVGSLILEHRNGTDPESTAYEAIQYYAFLPKDLRDALEDMDEPSELQGIIVDLVQPRCDPQLLQLLIAELSQEGGIQWVWEVLEMLGSEEEDIQEQEETKSPEGSTQPMPASPPPPPPAPPAPPSEGPPPAPIPMDLHTVEDKETDA